MHPRTALLIAAFSGCLACGQIAQVGGDLSAAERRASFPSLLPIEALLSTRPTTTQITDASIASFEGQVAALRNRANLLAGPVVDGTTRAKMRAAIARAALR